LAVGSCKVITFKAMDMMPSKTRLMTHVFTDDQCKTDSRLSLPGPLCHSYGTGPQGAVTNKVVTNHFFKTLKGDKQRSSWQRLANMDSMAHGHSLTAMRSTTATAFEKKRCYTLTYTHELMACRHHIQHRLVLVTLLPIAHS
jgi:hypothetical protein